MSRGPAISTSPFVAQKDFPTRHYRAQKGLPTHPRSRETIEGGLEKMRSPQFQTTDESRKGDTEGAMLPRGQNSKGSRGPLAPLSLSSGSLGSPPGDLQHSTQISYLGSGFPSSGCLRASVPKTSSTLTGHHFRHILLVTAAPEPTQIQRDGP